MTRRSPLAALPFALTVGICGAALAQPPAGQPAPGGRPAAVLARPDRAVQAGPAYERRGRRDPFQPIDVLEGEAAAPAVASAKLKGIVRGSAARVLIETADGIGYILKLGDTLADGRLVEIGPDRVVFVVPSRGGSTNRVVLRLPDD